MAGSERYAAYDIVVVPFPYVDRLAEKRRPALVVSTAELAKYGVIWVAMITSAQNAAWDCDVAIGDLERAGLPAASVVRAAKIAAIDPGRVVRRAGALEAAAARKVAAQLHKFLSVR